MLSKINVLICFDTGMFGISGDKFFPIFLYFHPRFGVFL